MGSVRRSQEPDRIYVEEQAGERKYPPIVPDWRPVPQSTLLAWGGRHQHHMIQANKAARIWEARSEWLDAYCRRNGLEGADKRTKKAEDWQMKDAMDGWSWNEREAKRFHSAIQAELAMRALLGAQP